MGANVNDTALCTAVGQSPAAVECSQAHPWLTGIFFHLLQIPPTSLQNEKTLRMRGLSSHVSHSSDLAGITDTNICFIKYLILMWK